MTRVRQSISRKYDQPEELLFWRTVNKRGLYDYEKQIIEDCLPSPTFLLDVGCGCGREARALTLKGHRVIGIDLCLPMLSIAMREAPQACYVATDAAEAIPFSCHFDCVLLLEQVYQHIPTRAQRLRMLRNVWEALRPAGIVIISSYNEGRISLLDRALWIIQTRFVLARSVALHNEDPMSRRYTAETECRVENSELRGTMATIKIARWCLGYFRHLCIRKAKFVIWSLTGVVDQRRAKRIDRINPSTITNHQLVFAVLALSEVEEELRAQGFEVVSITCPLDPGHRLSRRARRGSPLLSIAARKLGDCCAQVD